MKNENLEDFRPVKFSRVEEAYRRGYCHGAVAIKNNPDLGLEEIYNWRHGNEEIAPPGSALEGMHLDGLTEDEEHRFFINRLKNGSWKD